MEALETACLWLVREFDTTRYMWHTKVQAICWSAADVVLILAFLKVVDLLKNRYQAPPIRYRYWWLWTTAAMKLTPFFFHTPDMFISLDFFICGIQYAILVHTIIVDYRLLMKLPEWFQGASTG